MGSSARGGRDGRAGVLAAAFVAVLAASAGASKYELAEEWPGIAFNDGSKGVVYFMHLPDVDAPAFDVVASTPAAAGAPPASETYDPYVSLYALRVKEVVRQGPAGDGDVRSLRLLSKPAGYKLYLRLDAQRRRHAVKGPSGFRTEIGNEQSGLLGVFGLTAARPEWVLVVVRPEEASAPPAAALNEVERAAIESLDEPQRGAMAGECRGGPDDPEAVACWREKAREVLGSHTAAGAGRDLTAFERRYIKERLSAKGYERFQRALESPGGDADKLSLIRNWHDLILGLDAKENPAASGKPAPSSGVAGIAGAARPPGAAMGSAAGSASADERVPKTRLRMPGPRVAADGAGSARPSASAEAKALAGRSRPGDGPGAAPNGRVPRRRRFVAWGVFLLASCFAGMQWIRLIRRR